MPGDVLTEIRSRGHIGIRLGLERMRALLAELGDPHLAMRGTLIGGTNGKGSVAAMVAAMLRAAGRTTTQSPSPHLASYRERITVDGRPMSEDDLVSLLEEVLRASGPGESEHGPATEFELFVAAAYLWSARRGVDVVVMEVGLGGRLDASNTWDADVAAITNVGLDHQAFLGDSIASVASEKAAIIKPGRRAVTGASGPALEVIAARARGMGATLTVARPLTVEHMDLAGLSLRHPQLGAIRVPLLGRHQAANVAVALGVVSSLASAGVTEVSDEAIVGGLAQVRWPGRLELLERAGRPILIDGAHNPDGAAALAAAVDELTPLMALAPSPAPARQRPSDPARGRAPSPMTLLMGILADKAVGDVVAALASSESLRLARCVATGVPDNDRSLPARDLAAAWASATGRQADAVLDDVDAALERALELAHAAQGLLVVTGSLYLVARVRARLLAQEYEP